MFYHLVDALIQNDLQEQLGLGAILKSTLKDFSLSWHIWSCVPLLFFGLLYISGVMRGVLGKCRVPVFTAKVEPTVFCCRPYVHQSKTQKSFLFVSNRANWLPPNRLSMKTIRGWGVCQSTQLSQAGKKSMCANLLEQRGWQTDIISARVRALHREWGMRGRGLARQRQRVQGEYVKIHNSPKVSPLRSHVLSPSLTIFFFLAHVVFATSSLFVQSCF
jgi:hypothetical protein